MDPRYDFERNTRLANRGMKLFGAWFVFCAVAGLSVLGAVGYVAVHFLQKVW
jgi:hypothetical protein